MSKEIKRPVCPCGKEMSYVKYDTGSRELYAWQCQDNNCSFMDTMQPDIEKDIFPYENWD